MVEGWINGEKGRVEQRTKGNDGRVGKLETKLNIKDQREAKKTVEWWKDGTMERWSNGRKASGVRLKAKPMASPLTSGVRCRQELTEAIKKATSFPVA